MESAEPMREVWAAARVSSRRAAIWKYDHLHIIVVSEKYYTSSIYTSIYMSYSILLVRTTPIILPRW
jgi:hypothetical protein